MEFVILPPNTSPNVMIDPHTLVDTRMNPQDFQNKVHEIMSIPMNGQANNNTTSRKNNGDNNTNSDDNNMQRNARDRA